MDTTFDDEAAIPPAVYRIKGRVFTPELNYRLSWFDGENAGGTWTLNCGTTMPTATAARLPSWSITVCEPPPPPVCPVGYQQVTVFTSDFEAGNGGFTHSGTQDEWEWGMPTFAPITTCNSGCNCWKTDLDNTYNASSSQDLLSPAINLAGLVRPGHAELGAALPDRERHLRPRLRPGAAGRRRQSDASCGSGWMPR